MRGTTKDRDYAKKKIIEFIKWHMPDKHIHTSLQLAAMQHTNIDESNVSHWFREKMSFYSKYLRILNAAKLAKYYQRPLLSIAACEELEALTGDRWLMLIGQYLAICEMATLKFASKHHINAHNMNEFFDETFHNGSDTGILSSDEFKRVKTMLIKNELIISATIKKHIDANWQIC